MPAIPLPPTQKNVIEEILNRNMRCEIELQLEYIFLEVNHIVIYKVIDINVLQVLFNQKPRVQFFETN